MQNTKTVRIILLVLFGCLTFISFALLFTTLLSSFESQSTFQILPKIIGLTLLSILSSISFSLVKAWNNFFNVFAKIFISISTLLLGIVIIIFTLANHNEDITSSLQPTIDTIIINYLSNQTSSNNEMQTIQTIIEQPQKIVELNAQNITSNKAKQFLNIVNISTQKPIEISQILITVIDDHISTNQPQFENSPLPITIIAQELQNFSNQPLDELTTVITYNPNATIYVMYPQNTLNSTSNNLAYIRNQCEEIPQNLLCEQIDATTYSSIITNEISKNTNISEETLKEINSTQNLQSFIVSKTNSAKYLLLLVILGIILAIICTQLNDKINKKETKPSKISFFISSKLFFSMLFPTGILVATYYFLTSNSFEKSLQNFLSQLLQETFSISFQKLPLFLEFKEMLQTIMIIHIIILITILLSLGISYYFLKKEKEKETEINHF